MINEELKQAETTKYGANILYGINRMESDPHFNIVSEGSISYADNSSMLLNYLVFGLPIK